MPQNLCHQSRARLDTDLSASFAHPFKRLHLDQHAINREFRRKGKPLIGHQLERRTRFLKYLQPRLVLNDHAPNVIRQFLRARVR